ncbi:hypothetical protein WJX81_007139 [Elliptochloris bilobata]|uniref:MYND-type domain-containing protein n=1 Tax=Elliptochloris bilobata TaxID=381761 RepID=A0AAW1SJH9_9CHLO
MICHRLQLMDIATSILTDWPSQSRTCFWTDAESALIVTMRKRLALLSGAIAEEYAWAELLAACRFLAILIRFRSEDPEGEAAVLRSMHAIQLSPALQMLEDPDWPLLGLAQGVGELCTTLPRLAAELVAGSALAALEKLLCCDAGSAEGVAAVVPQVAEAVDEAFPEADLEALRLDMPQYYRIGCSNPGCVDTSGVSEAHLKTFVCDACRVARYCGAPCQVGL